MTTYVMLANFTETGVKGAKDSPRRLDAARELLTNMGGTFLSFYLTMGAYDMIAIYEASDDAVAARFTLKLGALGWTVFLHLADQQTLGRLDLQRGGLGIGQRLRRQSDPFQQQLAVQFPHG